jgi:cytidylate kinase
MVVGPPAVGKSSTSRALAARFPKSIHISVDDIRHMVVSGLKLPDSVWTDELAQQVSLARHSVVEMTKTYRSAGFAVVIDDFWDANHAADYQALFGQAEGYVGKIVLYPDQTEAHQRNLKRSGDSPARTYIDQGIRDVYQRLNPFIPQLEQEGWLIVDTTTMGVEDVVTAILQQTGIGTH